MNVDVDRILASDPFDIDEEAARESQYWENAKASRESILFSLSYPREASVETLHADGAPELPFQNAEAIKTVGIDNANLDIFSSPLENQTPVELDLSSSPVPQHAAVPAPLVHHSDGASDVEEDADSVDQDGAREVSADAQQEAATNLHAGRSLRHRSAKQLNPFSTEQARYVQTMRARDWQDAVIKVQHREMTAQELAERAEALKERGADDLDGWLELEDGMQARKLPEYERQAVEDEYVQLVPGRKRKHRSEADKRDRLLRRALGDQVSSSGDSDAPPAGDRYTPRTKQRAKAERSHSEPLSSSPIAVNAHSRPKVKKRKRATDDSAIRLTSGSLDLLESDEDLPDDPFTKHAKEKNRRQGFGQKPRLSNANNTFPKQHVIDLDDSEDVQDPEDVQQIASNDSDSDPVVDKYINGSRFKLDHRKRRHLRGMMPGIFLKKAEADLKLMQREKAQGRKKRELYERGSGDEYSQEENGNSPSRSPSRNVAQVRRRPTTVHEPLRAYGDQEVSDSDEDVSHQRRETDALSMWLGVTDKRYGASKSRHQPTHDEVLDHLLVQSRKGKSRNKGRRSKKQCSKYNHNSNRQHGYPRDTTPADHGEALFDVTNRMDAQRAVPVQQIIPAPFPAQKISARWANLRTFSHDFDIQKPPAGVTWLPHSLIAEGRLQSLMLAMNDDYLQPQLDLSYFPFGVRLDSDILPSGLTELVPQLFDDVYDKVLDASAAEAPDIVQLDKNRKAAADLFYYLGSFVSARGSAYPDFVLFLQNQLDLFMSRFRHLKPHETARTCFEHTQLQISCHLLQLVTRMYLVVGLESQTNVAIVSPKPALRKVVTSLMKYGPTKTGKALKILSNAGNHGRFVHDASIDAWVTVISLCLHAKAESLGLPGEDQLMIWIEEELDDDSSSQHPIKTAEAFAYAMMVACSLSQISPSGHVLGQSRLRAHWLPICKALEQIVPAQNTDSNSEVTLRDNYIWNLFARVLTFATRWHWKLEGYEGIVPRLFDILNARSLIKLATDSSKDFPAFLQRSEDSFDVELDAHADTCFHIFLKILIQAGRSFADEGDTEANRKLSRLITRVTPMRKMPFTRNANLVQQDRSMLVNHLSIYIVIFSLVPAGAVARFAQMRNLLPIEEADDLARPVIIRAMLYCGKLFHRLSIPQTPVLDCFAFVCQYMRGQYMEAERKRSQLATDASEKQATGMSAITGNAERIKQEKILSQAMFNLSMCQSMILRGLQNLLMLQAGDETSARYPDAVYLHHSWTRAILNSPIAQDPFVGIEIIRLIGCFLRLRNRAMQRAEIQQASQDEYGMGDFDVDDPALNALIGYDASQTSAAVSKQTKDAEFAELLRTQISASIYKLLIAIFTPQLTKRSGPVITDNADLRASYVEQLVECWVGCAFVLVENGLRDWSSYLNYGDEAFKRISEPTGRALVGMLFAIHLSQADTAAFMTQSNDMLGIWITSLVVAKPTYQHTLTEAVMLNLSEKHALLQNLTSLTEVTELTLRTFIDKRSSILYDLFSSICQIISGRAASTGTSRPILLGWLNELLIAMRSNLDALPAAASYDRQQYTQFCQATIAALKTAGHPYLNERTVTNLRLFQGIMVTNTS